MITTRTQKVDNQLEKMVAVIRTLINLRAPARAAVGRPLDPDGKPYPCYNSAEPAVPLQSGSL